MALAGAACISLFSYILRKMDCIPLVHMHIKMLGNTLRAPICLHVSAAVLPAELETQTHFTAPTRSHCWLGLPGNCNSTHLLHLQKEKNKKE